jgi:hypothetical protein
VSVSKRYPIRRDPLSQSTCSAPRLLRLIPGTSRLFVLSLLPVAVCAALLALAACETPPAGMDSQAARAKIEGSPVFQGSWDPAIGIDGTPLSRDPSWHRELLDVRGVEVRGSGVSAFARVGFTWRWNAGPFEGSTFKATALFLNTGAGWQLQEKKLQNEIWKQERRAE